MGEKTREVLKLQFDKRLRLEFHGARITSDAGLLVCRAALTRTESRGVHYRADYPEEDKQWVKTIEISLQSGKMTLEATPVACNEESWI